MSQRKEKYKRALDKQYKGIAEDVDDLRRRVGAVEARHRKEDRLTVPVLGDREERRSRREEARRKRELRRQRVAVVLAVLGLAAYAMFVFKAFAVEKVSAPAAVPTTAIVTARGSDRTVPRGVHKWAAFRAGGEVKTP